MQYDLKMIKKKYGEKMSHLCRTLFPSILETEGLLYSLLESKFHPSKFLYDDIIENGEADFPFLGANIVKKSTSTMPEWLEEYTIIENNGLKVGIIGVIGDEFC